MIKRFNVKYEQLKTKATERRLNKYCSPVTDQLSKRSDKVQFVMATEKLQYVIFDCDTGADDAWALLMLCRAENLFRRIKILAVTCTAGNSDITNVMQNTIRVLNSIDRTDLPVYKGCSKALIAKEYVHISSFHGKNGFGDVKFDDEIELNRTEKMHAVNVMYDLVCKYPGRISFLMVGPLTNLAMCANMYDDFFEKVKDVWIMGGNIRGKGNITKSAEFNFFCDPEAAHIVLNNARVPVYILPWETCIDGDFGITLKWRLEYLGSVDSKSIKMMNAVDKAIYIPKGVVNWITCDAILVAIFLYPKRMIVSSRPYHATIELNGTNTRGQLVLDHLREKDNNVHVITEVHKEHYRNVIAWTSGIPEADDIINEQWN